MKSLLGKVAIDTRPLRIKAFRRLWLSTVITAVGSQLTAVAVPKQVYDVTGSSGWVGVAAGVALVPLLVFGLWGGAVADVVDRRKLLVVTNAGIAVTSVLLWLQAAFDTRSVWVVIALLGLQQVFFAANSPARTASIARLVPEDQIPAAVALNSTVMMFGGVFGPMLAGALMPVVGLSTLYLVDAVALTLTIWAVWKLPPLPPLDGVSRRPALADVVDGFRYLALQKVLLASFLLDIIAMVFGMPRALFPEMAEETFGDPVGGGLALGWLFAAIPLGAMVCGLASGWTSRVHRHGVGVVVSIVAWGLAMVGFGMSHALWLAVVFLAIGGAADMISMVFRSAILQSAATDEMRGRMQGVFIVVVAGGPRLADLLHGTTGAVVGAGAATAWGGVAVVVATVLAVVAIPSFWRYRFSVGSVGGSVPTKQPAG
ncbi:MFS transporter [Saccharothrix australiensis]|uniref:Putative MFS family arabinose efflux permease n=1 Tax=Saccharothrix australiensis TaxID=2072 RepID=A0A495VSK4_9PSEU|nr:MFS transporter [Saccharothrix australiensis]RKT52346.1 putative MFS family arabinose efflux permease [Saccharothrix australiensis]